MSGRLPIVWIGGGLLALGLASAAVGVSQMPGREDRQQRLYDRLDALIGSIAEEHDAIAEQERDLADQAPIYGDDLACQKTGPGLGWCVTIPKPQRNAP